VISCRTKTICHRSISFDERWRSRALWQSCNHRRRGVKSERLRCHRERADRSNRGSACRCWRTSRCDCRCECRCERTDCRRHGTRWCSQRTDRIAERNACAVDGRPVTDRDPHCAVGGSGIPVTGRRVRVSGEKIPAAARRDARPIRFFLFADSARVSGERPCVEGDRASVLADRVCVLADGVSCERTSLQCERTTLQCQRTDVDVDGKKPRGSRTTRRDEGKSRTVRGLRVATTGKASGSSDVSSRRSDRRIP
jgi:hypothetical protein